MPKAMPVDQNLGILNEVFELIEPVGRVGIEPTT